MLLKFSIANYRSIKDNNSINMEARPIKDRSENICPIQVGKKKVRVLKSMALIGINAAGKSNWFKGFNLMRKMVLYSASADASTYSMEPFALSSESDNKPTTFECTMRIKNIIYRYGFKCDNDEIKTEWLTMKIKSREEIIFNRTKSEYQIVKHFPNDVKKKLLMIGEITGKNVLYISTLTQFNISVAVGISEWFSGNIFYDDSNLAKAVARTTDLLAQPKYSERIKEVLAKATPDTISVNAIADLSGTIPFSINRIKYDAKKRWEGEVLFNFLESESLGTQKLFAIIGPMVKILTDGGLFWIDDLDAQINSWIVPIIIDLFNSAEYNRHEAQLMLISYNQQLSKHIRSDQIVFVHKNGFGETSLSLRKPSGVTDLSAEIRSINKNGKVKRTLSI